MSENHSISYSDTKFRTLIGHLQTLLVLVKSNERTSKTDTINVIEQLIELHTIQDYRYRKKQNQRVKEFDIIEHSRCHIVLQEFIKNKSLTKTDIVDIIEKVAEQLSDMNDFTNKCTEVIATDPRFKK